MSCPILPKGFIDCSGHYMAKTKPIFKVLLQPHEVIERKALLSELLEGADKSEFKVINKELGKLERRNGA